eukprot:scaffold4892_cov119-Isochrysis_galbana.AAC.5
MVVRVLAEARVVILSSHHLTFAAALRPGLARGGTCSGWAPMAPPARPSSRPRPPGGGVVVASPPLIPQARSPAPSGHGAAAGKRASLGEWCHH